MGVWQRWLSSWIAGFAREERGAVLIYVSLMLPVLMGVSLLAIDGARIYNLGTELQKAADALALAGAAELDRRPNAIVRADAAIANLVHNEQRFFTQGGFAIASSDLTVRYLRNLPASDADPILTSHTTTDPAYARFVEVKVNSPDKSNPRILTTILPASFIGASSTVVVSATAVAGFTSVVCRTTPMFICNPFEGTGTSIFSSSAKGRQIKMQLGPGGTSQYFPGNYGWLDSPTYGNGANALRDALASVNPPACFEQNGVILQTGNIESANNAINVRFDLWEGPYNGQRNNSDYRPAANVRKGYAPGSGNGNGNSNSNGNGNNNGNNSGNGNGSSDPCAPKSDATTSTYKLGHDASYPDASGRLGNGAWDFDAYWTSNYGAGTAPNTWSNSNRPTRYQVYKHEVSTIGSGSLTDLVARKSAINEVGNPTCYSGSTPATDPDRRLIYAAIVNCSELNIRGGSSGPIPVLAFGKFFLTEPVPKSPSSDAGTIYSEFVDIIRPGSIGNEVARDKVQLYR